MLESRRSKGVRPFISGVGDTVGEKLEVAFDYGPPRVRTASTSSVGFRASVHGLSQMKISPPNRIYFQVTRKIILRRTRLVGRF